MQPETCKDCFFFLPGESEMASGACRRYPPQGFMLFQPERQSKLEISGHKVMTPAQGSIISQYVPVMPNNAVCGETKPKMEVEK